MKALALVRVDRRWIVACIYKRLKDGTLVLSPMTKPQSLDATRKELERLSKDEAVSGQFAFCPVCHLAAKIVEGHLEVHESLEHTECPGSRWPLLPGTL